MKSELWSQMNSFKGFWSQLTWNRFYNYPSIQETLPSTQTRQINNLINIKVYTKWLSHYKFFGNQTYWTGKLGTV